MDIMRSLSICEAITVVSSAEGVLSARMVEGWSIVFVRAWNRDATRFFTDSLLSISYSIATGIIDLNTREKIFTQPMWVTASYSGPNVSFNTQNKHSPKMPSTRGINNCQHLPMKDFTCVRPTFDRTNTHAIVRFRQRDELTVELAVIIQSGDGEGDHAEEKCSLLHGRFAEHGCCNRMHLKKSLNEAVAEELHGSRACNCRRVSLLQAIELGTMTSGNHFPRFNGLVLLIFTDGFINIVDGHQNIC